MEFNTPLIKDSRMALNGYIAFLLVHITYLYGIKGNALLQEENQSHTRFLYQIYALIELIIYWVFPNSSPRTSPLTSFRLSRLPLRCHFVFLDRVIFTSVSISFLRFSARFLKDIT